jgi:signal transduction histidine kinase
MDTHRRIFGDSTRFRHSRGHCARRRDGAEVADSTRECWLSHSVRVRVVFFALSLALLVACATPESAWSRAEGAWVRDRDPAAYSLWTTLDPDSPEGARARARLRAADVEYRNGIEQLEEGESQARTSFERAIALGPMDPRLYLPLARAFLERARSGQGPPSYYVRADQAYRRFLAWAPTAPEVASARAELEALGVGSELLPAALSGAPAAPEPPSWPPFWLLLLGALLPFVGLTARRALAPRGRSLRALVDARPELHPAILYLVATLRHELLKHRIGAIGPAVLHAAQGRLAPAEQAFLIDRLFSAEPLTQAFEGHITSFERALGAELDLRKADREFRDARRAIGRIARAEAGLRAGEPRALRALVSAHRMLRGFDQQLAELCRVFGQTRLDGALLRDVCEQVLSEYVPARVQLETLAIQAPEPAPRIEVFRVDLILILKNLVRNAILAQADQSEPKRLALEVRIELLPTAEEAVVLRILDSAIAPLRIETLRTRPLHTGLGLVTAALARYDGTLDVEPAEPPYTKSLTLRFFGGSGALPADRAA